MASRSPVDAPRAPRRYRRPPIGSRPPPGRWDCRASPDLAAVDGLDARHAPPTVLTRGRSPRASDRWLDRGFPTTGRNSRRPCGGLGLRRNSPMYSGHGHQSPRHIPLPPEIPLRSPLHRESDAAKFFCGPGAYCRDRCRVVAPSEPKAPERGGGVSRNARGAKALRPHGLVQRDGLTVEVPGYQGRSPWLAS